MASILNFFKSIYKAWISVPYKNPFIKNTGPNNLEELLKQFDLPKIDKTQADIIRDYQIKETLTAIEIDFLKMEPSIAFQGAYKWKDFDGNIFFDWVPCVIRPETVYCSYGKN